jgi:hypothetical protein
MLGHENELAVRTEHPPHLCENPRAFIRPRRAVEASLELRGIEHDAVEGSIDERETIGAVDERPHELGFRNPPAVDHGDMRIDQQEYSCAGGEGRDQRQRRATEKVRQRRAHAGRGGPVALRRALQG